MKFITMHRKSWRRLTFSFDVTGGDDPEYTRHTAGFLFVDTDNSSMRMRALYDDHVMSIGQLNIIYVLPFAGDKADVLTTL